MKQKRLFLKAAVFAVVLIAAGVASWEGYLRSQGMVISYDDGGPLWASQRKHAYDPNATVFIGTSRMKYDIDLPTWQQLTGSRVVQLSNVGSTPLPMLQDLAQDTLFKGRLLMDVSEFLLFTQSPYTSKTPAENLDYYHKETPAQCAGFAIGQVLESKLVFLNKEDFSLNALLAKSGVPNRPEVYEMPTFPADFTGVDANRQCFMTERFTKDSNMINQVKGVWMSFGKMAEKTPPITDGAIDTIIATVKDACDKIRSRGGQVILVRPPSSGPFLHMERMGYPKARYWSKLIAATRCQGVYFDEYEATAHFECPEFSHLSRPMAVSYTKALINILHQKGITFVNTGNKSLALN